MAWEIAITLVIGLIMLVFAYLSVKIDKNHTALQILFLAISLFMSITGIAICIDLGNTYTQPTIVAILNGAYTVMIWATLLVLAYLLLMFIYNLYLKLLAKKKKDNDTVGEYNDEA
jgi:hypothetical protein